MDNVSRLKTIYETNIVPEMVKEFNYTNKHQVPRITKIVLSMGLGKRDIKKNVNDLTLIAGQKAVVTKAKKSVAQFNVRQGFESGAKVTLRNNNMYHFIDRLVNMALLNWRAFPGLSAKSINIMKKNLTISMGILDKRIFSEINDDSIKTEGLNVTICTNCNNVKELQSLLSRTGFPFRRI